jgi:uncharacterized RDD family membrane protein YckC
MIYPGILSRVKALIADSIIIVILMALISFIFTNVNDVPDYARIIAFVFIFLLYDPLLTSFTGGTIGHKVVGLEVKSVKDENKNIGLPFAIIRFLGKSLLGWISLLTINFNDKGKAIHDIIVGSVVLYKNKG